MADYLPEHKHVHHNDPAEPPNEGAESLVSALKLLFVALRLAMVVLVILLFRTGCFSVQPNEQVLTYRFGKMQVDSAGERVFSSGQSKLNWVWPKPVGNTLTLPASSIPQTVEASRFWEQQNTVLVNAPGQSGRDSTEAFGLGKEGYVITGDSHMYHVKATMTYFITRADQYFDSFYKLNDSGGFDVVASEALAKKVITSHLQQALTMEASRWAVDKAFYNDVNEFSQWILTRVRKDIDKLGYGIEIDRIDIKSDDKAALRQVRGTFNRVSEARVNARADVNKAKQKKSNIELEASRSASRIIAEARVYHQKIISRLKNLQDLDTKKGEGANLEYVYIEFMSKILEKVKHRFVMRRDSTGNDVYWLELGPEKINNSEDEADASKEVE